MFARKIGRPVSVARLLVANGYLSTTRTTSICCRSNNSIATHQSPLYCSFPLGNNLIIGRTYSDGITSSESESSGSSEDDEWTNMLDRVARASLSFVDQHGWSLEAIQAGVKSVGLPGVAHGVLKNGGYDLLKYFEEQCNSELSKHLLSDLQPLLFNEAPDKSSISLEEFIVAAVMKRLQLIQPYAHRWREALAIKSDIRGSWTHFHNLSVIADDIWHHSKDQSIDCDWYLKRALLALVYKRAEQRVVKDFSHEFTDTRQHVEQMVRQMMTHLANIRLARFAAEKVCEGSQQCLSEVGRAADAGVATVRNLIGINKMS